MLSPFPIVSNVFRSLIRSIAFSPTRGFPSDIYERRSFEKSLEQGFAEATLPLSPLCRFSEIFSYPQNSFISVVQETISDLNDDGFIVGNVNDLFHE